MTYVVGTDLFLDHVRCLNRDPLAVYAVLSKHADEMGRARVSLTLLGSWAGCGEARAHQAVRDLEQHRLLQVTRRPGHGNMYTLVFYESQIAPPRPIPQLAPEMPGPYLVN